MDDKSTLINESRQQGDETQVRPEDAASLEFTPNGQRGLQSGSLLANRYRIGNLLGVGGMGMVFEAYDPESEQQIAIKVLREELRFSDDVKGRFFQEAVASRALSHPHIVRVHDVSRSGGQYFFTMERLWGASLRYHITKHQAAESHFPIDEVLDIAHQLIDAFKYLQKLPKAIVHRDVKPENIWITDSGALKLMDFGIARILQDSMQNTQTRMLLGTPYYMAPEQRERPKSVDWRADQYALGVMLYELLTGTVPQGVMKPPHAKRAAIPVSISSAVMKAMASEPDARHQSWDELDQALASKSGRSRGSLLGVVVAGIVVAGGAVGLILHNLQPGKEPVAAPATAAPPVAAPATASPVLAPPSISVPPVKATSATVVADEEAQLLAGVMVNIPGGELEMGAVEGDSKAGANEKPRHTVQVKPFRLAAYEVAFEQYDRFVQATGHASPADQGWGRGKRPVMNVSWRDAQDYIGWLNNRTGRKFRLPTEAEWEHAARAGSYTPYPWGTRFDASQANGAHSENSTQRTENVDTGLANGFQLYNMIGNVWEWTQDCAHERYTGAPSTSDAWEQGNCARRMVRGGGWDSDVDTLRTSARHSVGVAGKFDFLGFRLAEDR